MEPVPRVDLHPRRGSADVAHGGGAVVALHRDVVEHESPDLDRLPVPDLGQEPGGASLIDRALIMANAGDDRGRKRQRDDQAGADEYSLHACSFPPARATPEPPGGTLCVDRGPVNEAGASSSAGSQARRSADLASPLAR